MDFIITTFIVLLNWFSLNSGERVILNTTSVPEGNTACLVLQLPQNLSGGISVKFKTLTILVVAALISKPHDNYTHRLEYNGDYNQKRISFCLKNITLDDDGDYYIELTPNNYTNILKVLVPLTDVHLNPNQKFELQESTIKIFECYARSIPLANITWFINGSAVIPSRSNSSLDTVTSYLTYIGNRTDHNKFVYCKATNGTFTSTSGSALIDIIYAPSMIPNVEQSPLGAIIAGDRVNLTCSTMGGNPLPNLTWSCSGDQEQNNTSGNKMSNSISFVVNRTDNNKICACSARHPIDTYRPVVNHTLVIFYAPENNLSVEQHPVEAIAQQNVKLTCKVSGGNPLAVLSWNCKGFATNDTAGNTASYSIEFNASKSDNNIVCTCSASHYVMSYRPTLQHRLIVLFPPDESLQIENGTESVVLYENMTANLNCKMVGGNPLATLNFVCINYTGENNSDNKTALSVVQFKVLRVLNGQMCKCVATHRLLENTTKNLTLIVYYPPSNPSLYFNPAQPLAEGRRAEVYCNATLGNPPENDYEWFIFGEHQPNQTSRIYIFSNVTKKDNMLQLQCKISNNFTDHMNIVRQSEVVTLNVHYYPFFIINVSSVTVNESETLYQTCIADGNPVPDVQWFFENVALSQSRQNMTTLRINSIDRSQSGSYECRANASSPHGQLERSFMLEIIVNYAPDVIIRVNSSNLDVNNTITLTCIPNGIPQSYSFSGWQHSYENTVIRNSEKLSQIQINAGQTLVLANMTYQDMGEYRCSANNGIIGRNGLLDQMNSTHVFVTGPPIIRETDEIPTFTTEPGYPLAAKFDFFAYPNVTEVQWYNTTSDVIHPSNSAAITLSQIELPMNFHDINVNVVNFSYQACLQLKDFQKANEGNYLVMIKNHIKGINVTFRAAISGHPEPPSDIRVLRKSDTTVSIAWKAGFDGGNYQKFNVIYYALGFQNEPLHRIVDDDKNKTQYITITELKPSTTYLFCLFASNSKGNSSLNGTCCVPFNVTTDSKYDIHSPEKSSLIAGVAAGVATGAVVIIAFFIAVLVKRRIISQQKGKTTETNGRSRLTKFDDNEDENGLKDNILYQSVGSDFVRGEIGRLDEYAVVKKSGKSARMNLDTQETALHTTVEEKNKKRKTDASSVNKNKQKDKLSSDVYENVFEKHIIHNKISETNRNKDGLQYADLVFNQSPTGAKFIIHGLDDKTIYAVVDTTQKIDPLPDSDEEDKLKDRDS